MKKINLNMMGVLLLTILLSSCHLGPASVLDPKEPPPTPVPETIRQESEDLARIQKELRGTLEQYSTKKPQARPVLPQYDPLDDRIVSFSVVNEELDIVLYSLAQAVGMNLIIDPNITLDERPLTLNFEKISAATVLKEVLTAYDLFYEIEENIIRVKPYRERIFNLNFLDTHMVTDFIVGGDVLGASLDDAAIGLSGSFKITGTGAKKGKANPYDIIEDNIKRIISQGGTYSINQMAGTLYVKDTPANIRSIAKMIDHAKEMMSRQILIVARLIEVQLRDEYKYGIEWDMVRQEGGENARRLDAAAWVVDAGLALQGVFNKWQINATIDALNTFGDVKIVSNPSIRAKHGQPAIISVGDSINYIESTSSTVTGTGQNTNQTTDITVSKVFDGLILGVIPFIEPNGTITMLVNPIKSDVDRESLQLIQVGLEQISLPEVNVKEISNVIAMNDGDVIILGGLISKDRVVINRGVPVLSAIPLLGYLFKSEFEREESTELVIIMTVTVI